MSRSRNLDRNVFLPTPDPDVSIMLCYGRGETHEVKVDTKNIDYIRSLGRWYIRFDKNGKPYVVANTPGKGTQLRLHREILGVKKGELVDHIDGDSLHNTEDNLRKANHKINNRNVRINPNSLSGYPGVNWDKQHNKWKVIITVNRKIIFLGRFNKEDLELAIQTRKDAENKYWGDER